MEGVIRGEKGWMGGKEGSKPCTYLDDTDDDVVDADVAVEVTLDDAVDHRSVSV